MCEQGDTVVFVFSMEKPIKKRRSVWNAVLHIRNYSCFFRNANGVHEYFALNIPTLLIAGAKDELVPVAENCGIMMEYCEENNLPLEVIIKPECGHHPHSLEDVTPIVEFIEK